MMKKVSSHAHSPGSPSSRKRRPMIAAAAMKPAAKQIPKVWIVSEPRWISG
jgi:hypothetical protein